MPRKPSHPKIDLHLGAKKREEDAGTTYEAVARRARIDKWKMKMRPKIERWLPDPKDEKLVVRGRQSEAEDMRAAADELCEEYKGESFKLSRTSRECVGWFEAYCDVIFYGFDF